MSTESTPTSGRNSSSTPEAAVSELRRSSTMVSPPSHAGADAPDTSPTENTPGAGAHRPPTPTIWQEIHPVFTVSRRCHPRQFS
ncbi:hypothetical protein SISNIDRAFT_455360 [Sistotremastrum niveocremeum HHB9708]|uniref:Uncharacterized protein n=2 Tax=Sistotremastraceae TaxID=3402574 RepID=A0A164TYF2_9AGAM|nr:hypothetical protein SISNIDRAFT_455360 [Sistotremastrum niveocremeum HHB9708]KZT35787.1 hypothetical protein SISSUDRAFT_1050898 [Sistotremastrum suecicum HHB10207 ss-3]